MALPAVQVFRERNPAAEIVILSRPAFAPLWRMSSAPSRVVAHAKNDSLRAITRVLRDQRFDAAYILPHSFRSALPPFCSRIPERIGLPGHFPRNVLLTVIRRPHVSAHRCHQAYEILDLLVPESKAMHFPPPVLQLHSATRQTMEQRFLPYVKPWFSFIPGAARGPSKQWPAGSFMEAARRMARWTGGTIFLLGTPSEAPLCADIAGACPGQVQNWAGTTSLEEMTACLALSDAVLCNDSGGMHLAAAVGTPLVALFGITNPEQTGPIGRAPIRILQHSALRTRDIPRHSPVAEAALRAISPEEAEQALISVLQASR
jgi:heptosyltransferase-2